MRVWGFAGVWEGLGGFGGVWGFGLLGFWGWGVWGFGVCKTSSLLNPPHEKGHKQQFPGDMALGDIRVHIALGA